MLDWITSNIANIVVISILVLAVALVIRKLVRDKKAGKSSCGCGCSNCSGACNGTDSRGLTDVRELSTK